MLTDKTGTNRTHGPPLSAREIRFCVGFVEHGNRTKAYRAAGFPVEGKDDNAVTQAACYLLRKSQIRQYIRDLQTEAADEAKLTVGRIAQALARVAFANRADLFDSKGRLLPKDQWPADAAATVESVETQEVFETVSNPGEPKRRELRGYVRKVHTAKRTEALRLLATWRRMIGRDAEIEEMERQITELRELLEKVKQRGQQG